MDTLHNNHAFDQRKQRRFRRFIKMGRKKQKKSNFWKNAINVWTNLRCKKIKNNKRKRFKVFGLLW